MSNSVTDVSSRWAYMASFKPQSITSSSSSTPTGNLRENELNITALATGITINTPSGTAIDNNTLVIRFDGAGAITWNAIYEGSLPTTVTAGTTLYTGFQYNEGQSAWQLIGLKEV